MPDTNEKATRITLGSYIAHVLPGGGGPERFWYYLIQRKGYVDIIDLEKHETYLGALTAVQEALQRLLLQETTS